MEKKPLTERMVLRIKALVAVKKAILPAFCEGIETCNESCPLFIGWNKPCKWEKTYMDIDELEQIVIDQKRA
jgi:hypothetical protein